MARLHLSEKRTSRLSDDARRVLPVGHPVGETNDDHDGAFKQPVDREKGGCQRPVDSFLPRWWS